MTSTLAQSRIVNTTVTSTEFTFTIIIQEWHQPRCLLEHTFILLDNNQPTKTSFALDSGMVGTHCIAARHHARLDLVVCCSRLDRYGKTRIHCED